MEEWKDIPGYVGYYEVSSLGRVRSVPRVVAHADGRRQPVSGRVLKQNPDDWGYLLVSLNKNGKGVTSKVHRLVAIAFIPNPENKPEVNHKTGDKTANSVTDLEWSTGKENTDHARRLSLYPKGIRRGTKLTPGDIPLIRSRIAAGHKLVHIAKDFRVSETTIGRIKQGVGWAVAT